MSLSIIREAVENKECRPCEQTENQVLACPSEHSKFTSIVANVSELYGSASPSESTTEDFSSLVFIPPDPSLS
jgi:hypothetical protein